MFPYRNNGRFPGNNQTLIEYKDFICLSNLQFNNILDRGTCPSIQQLCFSVTGYYTLCNTHDCFCGKSCIALESWMPKSHKICYNRF